MAEGGLQGFVGLGFAVVDPRLAAARGDQHTNSYQVWGCPNKSGSCRRDQVGITRAQEDLRRRAAGGWDEFHEPGDEDYEPAPVIDLNTGAGAPCRNPITAAALTLRLGVGWCRDTFA